MPTYITVEDVRRSSGVPDTTTEGGMSDARISAGIDLVEEEMARWLNTKFVPTEEIDFLDGNSSPRIFVKRKPLLKVFSLQSNDQTITIPDINIYRESGMIALKSSASEANFIRKAQTVIVRYLFGFQERSSTSTSTTAAATVGTSVALSVSSSTGFSANDWVEVYGTDGNAEVAQVDSTASGVVTVDELTLTHASGSRVVKLQIPIFVKRIMELEMVVYVSLFVIGGTYNFTTSYQIGDLSVTKGEPYPQWRENYIRAAQELKIRRSKVRPKIAIG